MKTKQWFLYAFAILAVIALTVTMAVCLIMLWPSEEPPSEHEHEFSTWGTVRAATCTENGEGMYFCACGAEEHFTIYAKHTPVLVPGKQATSTEEGLTEGKVCRVCGAVLREQTVLPPIIPWDGSVADAFAGGVGTQDNPYLIANGAQLARLVRMVKQQEDIPRRMHYLLVQDIDLGGLEWKPIGDATYRFDDSFDGNGKRIYHFKITEPNPVSNGSYQYFGLFGSVRDGRIINLHVEDFEINVTTDRTTPMVGGIVGSMWEGRLSGCTAKGRIYLLNKASHTGLLAGDVSGSTVRNCHAEGEILRVTPQYNSRVGGLIGDAGSSKLTECSSSVTLEGGTYTGGLVGYASSSTLTLCTASGAVSAQDETQRHDAFAGGLVGYTVSSTLNSCSASGTAEATCDRYATAGGLVGCAAEFTTVSRSFASGNVTADGHTIRAGGLIGYCYFIKSVKDCYASGEVHIAPPELASILAGGLVGCIEEGAVTRSYALGSVTAENKPFDRELTLHVGGLIGHAENASLSSCYATGNVSVTGNASVYAGGLLGYARMWNIGEPYARPVEYCFATGNVTVTYHADGITSPYGHAGGLFGDSGQGYVSSCFATGDVSGVGFTSPYSIGGLAMDCNPKDEGTLFTLAGQRLTLNGEAVTGVLFGNTCTVAQLNDPAFYTGALAFDPAEWIFDELDFAAGKLPSLKHPPSLFPMPPAAE